ncbi:MAG: mechanosensitive ion channel family protein [Kiritimatiellae bacterium]|nr:mechanosensitive ion channel family protein [Kiritimatiellia bacterium]
MMKIDVTKVNAMLTDYALPFLGICAWLIFGLWVSSLLSRMLYKGLSRRLGADTARAISKTAKLLLILLFVFSLIRGAGVDITAVLGAAGVVGVAIGFASQTSLSNLISGLFLVLERPFKAGDWIEVDGSSGYVHSVELLSTYIRTFDNRMVRIPNEMLAKSKLINYTHYPIRRLDLNIAVAYKEDPGRVMQIFREVVTANPACFNEPEPLIVFKGFGASSMEFLLAVWLDRTEIMAARTSLMKDIKERFDQEGVDIPYVRMRMKEGVGV